jgi:hypothetical protein
LSKLKNDKIQKQPFCSLSLVSHSVCETAEVIVTWHNWFQVDLWFVCVTCMTSWQIDGPTSRCLYMNDIQLVCICANSLCLTRDAHEGLCHCGLSASHWLRQCSNWVKRLCTCAKAVWKSSLTASCSKVLLQAAVYMLVVVHEFATYFCFVGMTVPKTSKKVFLNKYCMILTSISYHSALSICVLFVCHLFFTCFAEHLTIKWLFLWKCVSKMDLND